MKRLIHLRKEQQQLEPLFDGAFVENKPISFPQRGTTTAYSNLFYWAHLVAYETAEFPLHPHEGFEIMTFIFKGSLEHYDTATQVYTALNAGGVQVIQAGSGVQHSERIIKGSELFQIWFDPDFSKSMTKDAVYIDYQASEFKSIKRDSIERVSYLKPRGAINFQTEEIGIEKLKFDSGDYVEEVDKESTYSYYLLDGEMKINSEVVQKDSFLVLSEMDSVDFTVNESAELFVIKSPTVPSYKQFIERY